MELKNLERLPPEARAKIVPYLNKLVALYPRRILSIAVYGSTAGGNYIPKVSDINMAVVFDNVDFPVLKKALKVVSEGIRHKIAAPLFLTLPYIHSSCDVFPIEFLDIRENHVTVFGEEVFQDLTIETEHLRLFCEQQLKGRLIRIRQAYLEVGLKRQGIEALLKESLNSLFPVFRNLIRLKREQPPVDKQEIIAQVSRLFSLDAEVFANIFRDKTNDEKIAGEDVEKYFERYMKQLKILWEAVDKL